MTESGGSCPEAANVVALDLQGRDPTEAVLEEFAKRGAKREDGVIAEESIRDPNFAGVYYLPGEGTVVVAVVNCDAADLGRITALAGGADKVRIVEVPFSYRELNEFRDELAGELRALGIDGDVVVDSAKDGRHIEVRVVDKSALPETFGSSVPAAVFNVKEVDGVFRSV